MAGGGRKTPSSSHPRRNASPAEAATLRLLAAAREAKMDEHAGVDLGHDLRLESKGFSGSGLAWRDELIQLSLFPGVEV